MNQKACSKKQVERYLLNQMTLDEETCFQKHLMQCELCRTYVSEIRMIASFVGSEDLTFCAPQGERKTIQVWIRRCSAVACFILLIGISTFWMKKYQAKERIYSTSVEYNNRASADEVSAHLVSPVKDTIFQKRNQPVLFRWTHSSAFHLRIYHEGINLLEIEGNGTDYILSPTIFISYPSITWNLVIDEHSYFGQIILVNN